MNIVETKNDWSIEEVYVCQRFWSFSSYSSVCCLDMFCYYSLSDRIPTNSSSYFIYICILVSNVHMKSFLYRKKEALFSLVYLVQLKKPVWFASFFIEYEGPNKSFQCLFFFLFTVCQYTSNRTIAFHVDCNCNDQILFFCVIYIISNLSQIIAEMNIR